MKIMPFLVAIVALSSFAEEYHVSITGNDGTGNGSATTPWKTLLKAVNSAAAGDTISMHGGVHLYGSATVLSKQGTQASRFVIRGYPGESAILDGTNSSGSMSGIDDFSGSDAFYVTTGSYWTIRDLIIQNVKGAGVNFYGNSGNNINIVNCTFRTVYRSAIYMVGTTSAVSIKKCRFTECAGANKGFAFNHTGGWQSVVNMDGANSTLDSSFIYQNYGEGVGCYGDHQTVTNNVLHDNYSVEIYVNNITNGLVSGNFIYSYNLANYERLLNGVWWAAVGIECANEGIGGTLFDNNTIINNIVSGNRRVHFQWWTAPGGGGLRNSVIANNAFVGNGSPVVSLDAASHINTVFTNNIFMQTSGTSNATVATISGTSGLTFFKNCWFGGVVTGLSVGAPAGDVTTDPRIAMASDTTAIGFALLGNSPCINAGGVVNQAPKDFFGITRPQGADFDMGAIEYQSGTPVRSDLFRQHKAAGKQQASGAFTFLANGSKLPGRVSSHNHSLSHHHRLYRP